MLTHLGFRAILTFLLAFFQNWGTRGFMAVLEGLAAEPGLGPQAHHLLPAGRVCHGPLVLMPGSALHLWEMCKIEGLGLMVFQR